MPSRNPRSATRSIGLGQSAQIAAKMQAHAPGLQVAEVPDVGHAPLLDEPAAIAALDEFLQRTDDIA